MVGEPGSVLQWDHRADGSFVIDVVDGVAWVRRATTGPALRIVADGDVVEIGTCGRVEVERALFSVDVAVDDVTCGQVESAIEQARAELSRGISR